MWRLAWPSTLMFSLHALVGLVDFLFVSALGTEALAAVGAANQLHFLTFALLSSITTGTVAIVARQTGGGRWAEAAHTTRASVALATLIGAASMLAIPLAEPFVGLLGVNDEVTTLGGRCLAILLAFNVPFAVSLTLSMALRGAGDVRTPLAIGVVTNLFNVVADWALIFGNLGAPALGAEGSALATGLAFLLGMLLALLLWWRSILVLPWASFRDALSRPLARRLLTIGLPSALEGAAFNAGLLLFLRLVADYGTEAISAYLIGVRILSLCFIPGLGFATAASTLVGQHLGAEEPDLATSAGWRATRGAAAVMGGLGLVIIAFARPVASLFGAAGAETVDLTVTFIYILGAAQPLMAIEFAIGGGLRGAGDTRFPLFAILIGLFGFRLAAAIFIAGPIFGTVTAVWTCLLADYAAKAALLTWIFRSGAWQRIRV